MSTGSKIVSIQYLRGLAALGVVLCHYYSSIFSFGQSGVLVFFLISGFIIVYSLIKSEYKPSQFFKFLLKRSIRIDPSYFVTILVTITLFKILSYIPSYRGQRTDFIPGQFIAHIFYIVPFTKYPFYNPVFWTLCVEFQFYLIIGLIYFLSSSDIYKTIFLVLFGLTGLIPFANSYYLVFNYAPIFALGISLVTLYQRRTLFCLIIPCILLGLIGYKFGIPILLLLMMSCYIVMYLKKFITALMLLGDISYSLYLTHSLVLIVFLGIMKKLQLNLTNEFVLLPVEVLLALIFAYFFYRYIEKPTLLLSKRIFYKKSLPRISAHRMRQMLISILPAPVKSSRCLLFRIPLASLVFPFCCATDFPSADIWPLSSFTLIELLAAALVFF